MTDILKTLDKSEMTTLQYIVESVGQGEDPIEFEQIADNTCQEKNHLIKCSHNSVKKTLNSLLDKKLIFISQDPKWEHCYDHIIDEDALFTYDSNLVDPKDILSKDERTLFTMYDHFESYNKFLAKRQSSNTDENLKKTKV